MKTYLLVHNIKSSSQKKKLENFLSGVVQILNFESETGWFYYEFQSGIKKKELLELLNIYVKSLFLKNDERVVIYDPQILTDLFKKTSKKEKILLHGDLERENMVEEIMIKIFQYMKAKMVLDDVQNNYFNSLLNHTKFRKDFNGN